MRGTHDAVQVQTVAGQAVPELRRGVRAEHAHDQVLQTSGVHPSARPAEREEGAGEGGRVTVTTHTPPPVSVPAHIWCRVPQLLRWALTHPGNWQTVESIKDLLRQIEQAGLGEVGPAGEAQLRADNETLVRERDAARESLQDAMRGWRDQAHGLVMRAEAAERRVAQLEAALDDIASLNEDENDGEPFSRQVLAACTESSLAKTITTMHMKARAALRSREHGGEP